MGELILKYKKQLKKVPKDKRRVFHKLIALCFDLINLGATAETIHTYTDGHAISEAIKNHKKHTLTTLKKWVTKLSFQKIKLEKHWAIK